MKKILFTLFILFTSIHANVIDKYPSQEFLASKTPIVDIRTPGEWKETGLLKGAIPIMFFKPNGTFNVQEFLTKLNKAVDTKKTFALICRTSSRTTMVSNFLSQELGYTVVNLKGGMVYAKSKNLPIVAYKQ